MALRIFVSNKRGNILKQIGLTVIALIATTVISNAQGTATSPESNSAASGLCWDVNAGMILPDYRSTFGSPPNPGSTADSTLSSNTNITVGSALSSDHPNHMGSTFSKDATGTDHAHPAGMPNCD